MHNCLRLLSILAFAAVLFLPCETEECKDTTCEEEVDEPEPGQTEEVEDQHEEVTDQPQVTDEGEEGHCFRRREAWLAFATCGQSIGITTKERCCRRGGKGWIRRASGRGCEDTCLNDVPEGRCFSRREAWLAYGTCGHSFIGIMTKENCCRRGGKGWTTRASGTECEDTCLSVHGGWGNWGQQEPCSETCQSEGSPVYKQQRRRCNNPVPVLGGRFCEGAAVRRIRCISLPFCPIHGGWGNWEQEEPCSETCQSEGSPVYQQQRRQCNNPAPKFGGRPCHGAASRRIMCVSLPFCPNTVPGRECDRSCTDGDVRSCVFDWQVSYYYTMLNNTRNTQRPCGNCPFNQQDCNHEGCVTLNGLKRPVVTVNRQVPGPKIIVCKGDAIIVNVKNMLDDMTGITFHWHGMNQFGTPAMDGTAMITQCPIAFATTFTYKIIANDPGTYFWHSHIGPNRADGLAGPIVIREVNDSLRNTYDVDDSNHTVMIQDWMSVTQNTNYIAYLYGEGHNQPDFLLINGKGKGPACDKDSNESKCVPREVFYVERSLRYRIRVISNAFTGCQMRVSVDSHRLLAINIDSYPIKPVPFDALISNAGERFDFVLHANQSIGNYWLRLVGVGDNCNKLQELAIVRYRNAPTEDPLAPEKPIPNADVVLNVPARSSVDATTPIRMINITSLISFSPDAKVNQFYLPLGLEKPKRSDNSLRSGMPQINHITFTFPPVPLLTQHDEVDQSFFCDAREAGTWTNCTDFLCQCTQMISVDLHETVELFFYNGHNETNSCHPMHLHGFSYRIVGMGLLRVNGTQHTPAEIQRRDRNGEFPRLRTNFPPNKDTICVAHGSYLILQFVANNPGWWFLHCHLDFHALIGMAMVVRVGTNDDLLDLIPSHFPRCENFAPYHA